MSSESPDVVLYDGNGNAIAVQNGAAIPSNTSGIISMGSDGTDSRYISVDGYGRPVVVGAGTAGTDAGGVLTVQGAAAGVPMPVSPLSPSDVFASGSLTALGTSVPIDTQGASTLVIYVSGTWTGTILVESSLDNGVTWPGGLSIFTGIGGGFIVYPSGITTNGFYYVSCGGSRLIRLYMSAYTSGTAVIQAVASSAQEYVRGLSFLSDGTNFANIAPPTTAATASQTALVVALSPNIPGGAIPVALSPSGAQDVLGNAVTVSRVPQITTKFYQQPPSSFMNVTTTGGATATQGTGVNIGAAVFSTGTAATAEVTGVTFATIAYATQFEAWTTQSAKFTTPTSAASYQRLGIYNTLDGFSWGYNGTTFGLWTRYNGTDTFVAQTAWNKDTLSGAVGSLFTSAGVPVSLVPTYFNKYRIRYSWYGSACIFFEVYAPDGIWVLVHLSRFTDSLTTLNLTDPDLPLTIDINKSASDSTNLVVACGAWSAGVTAPPTGPIVTGIQTISTNGQYTIIPVLTQSSLSFTISGTWVGTIAFNYSLDGVNFSPDTVLDNSLGTFVSSTTINNAYTANVGSYKYYQIVATAWTSGTATITYNGSAAVNLVTSQSLITDASNHGPAAVKAASTAAVATDSALVVALSPNSSNITSSAITTSGAIAANGNVLALPGGGVTTIQGYSGITFEVSGTWSGTLTFQGTNGGSFFAVDVVSLANPNAGAQSMITANGMYYAPLAYTNFRLVMSNYVSGTVTVYAVLCSISPAIPQAGSAISVANGQQAIQVINAENERPTYSIGIENFATAATNQDVFILIGSATKIVRVTRIQFSMTVTTSVVVPVQLIKRSTLNAGGTTGVALTTPLDSNNATATATNLAYATNYTTGGTVVGTMIRSQKYFAQATGIVPTTECQLIDWVFGQNGCQPPTLRSATQSICINLGGVTIAGGSVSASIEWTEDNN
jgi:hypothetical protein